MWFVVMTPVPVTEKSWGGMQCKQTSVGNPSVHNSADVEVGVTLSYSGVS